MEMSDPTYVEEEIRKNPEWDLAFVLSEILIRRFDLGVLATSWKMYAAFAGIPDKYGIHHNAVMEWFVS